MRSLMFCLGSPADGENPAETYASIIEEAQEAEALGYDGALVAEHHFVPNYATISNPLMLAAAIGQATRRLRVGAASVVVPLHNPVRVAEDIRTLDWLTGGRAEVAFARGDHPYEYETLGIDYAETHQRFEAGLSTICAQLRGHVDGKRMPSGASQLPMPPTPQRPHPPLWLTAGSAGSIGQALDHGVHVAVSAGSDPLERVPAMSRALAEACRARGLDPAAQRLGMLCTAALVHTAEERRRAVAWPEFVGTYATTMRDGRFNSDPAKAISVRLDPERYAAGHPIGDLEHIRKVLDWYRAHGVTDLILMFARSMGRKRLRQSMEAVAPLLGATMAPVLA